MINLLNIILVVVSVSAGGAAVMLHRRNRRLVHEHRDLEKKLEAADSKYRLVLENSGDGIVVVQDDGFRFANQKVYEIIGVRDAGPVNLMDFIHPDDLPDVRRKYAENAGDRAGTFTHQLRINRHDESVAWVHIRSVPILWAEAPASLTFIRDITRQKMVEDQLQQAQRMEAIGTLAGGIAHDFNNILATIMGNAELALMNLDESGRGHKEFRRILESGHRARDLVNQILTVSRTQNKEIRPVMPGPVVKEAVKLLRTTFPASIRITDSILAGTDRLMADPTQIHQVVVNLCANARQAMGETDPGTLRVELKTVALTEQTRKAVSVPEAGTYFELTVSDSGAGIDPAVIRNIFDPYFTTHSREGQSGLGLATARGIVRQYGGQITVDSRPGEGSTFRVYLPVYTEPAADGPPSGAAPPVSSEFGGRQGRILFVDDEQSILEIGERMFTNLGYRVTVAGSGQEALAVFSDAPDLFDILVTDMAMPGMTGVRLAEEVLKIRPGFPVILCTGYSESVSRDTVMDTGIREYVTKPYKLKDLASIVSEHIRPREGHIIAPSVS